MKIINAAFSIKEEKREEFLAEVRALIAATLQEDECLAYHLYESTEERNKFMMVENWQDQAAIEKHNESPLLRQLFANMPNYAAAASEITVSEKLI